MTQLARQWQIIRSLAHGGASLRELRETHGVTARTILRDLEDIRAAGFALSVKRTLSHGKQIWTIPRTIPAPSLGANP